MIPSPGYSPNQTEAQAEPDRSTKNDSLDSRQYAPAISGHELRDLLAPITLETFMAEYWGRKPLLIKGQPDKVEKLFGRKFDREALLQTVRETASKSRGDFELLSGTSASLLPSDDKPSRPIFPIQADSVEAVFAKGESILAQNLSDQRLATFAAAIKAQLNHPGVIQVRSTITPEGGRHGAHIDATCGIFIHCEGRKRFLLSSEPVMAWPLDSGVLTADGAIKYNRHVPEDWEKIKDVDTSNLTEVVMEPGDVLFFPAGTIHATEAIEGDSFGINFQFVHINFFDLITPILKSMLLSNPAWRYLPAASPDSAGLGELPADVEQFFAARLEELRDAISTLKPGGLELSHDWHKLVADPGRSNVVAMSLGPGKSSGEPIERQDILCLSKKAPVKYAVGTNRNGGTTVHLFYADKKVSVSGEWAPFLRRLVDEESFVAESAINWAGEGKQYEWDRVRKNLQVLLDKGILQRREF